MKIIGLFNRLAFVIMWGSQSWRNVECLVAKSYVQLLFY